MFPPEAGCEHGGAFASGAIRDRLFIHSDGDPVGTLGCIGLAESGKIFLGRASLLIARRERTNGAACFGMIEAAVPADFAAPHGGIAREIELCHRSLGIMKAEAGSDLETVT